MPNPAVTNTTFGSANAVTSVSFSHTTDAGNQNTFLIAFCGQGATVSSATYNSVAADSIVNHVGENTVHRSYAYWINPATGTNTLIVNWAAATDADVSAISVKDVDQTTPVDAGGNLITWVGNPTSFSKDITTNTGNTLLLFSVWIATGTNRVEGAGQTTLHDSVPRGAQIVHSSSKNAGAAAAVENMSLSWTTGANGDGTIIALTYKAPPLKVSKVSNLLLLGVG